jgi:hypothetical protein
MIQHDVFRVCKRAGLKKTGVRTYQVKRHGMTIKVVTLKNDICLVASVRDYISPTVNLKFYIVRRADWFLSQEELLYKNMTRHPLVSKIKNRGMFIRLLNDLVKGRLTYLEYLDKIADSVDKRMYLQ